MKYNKLKYTKSENAFIKAKMSNYTQIKTLGSHSTEHWRELVFIGFSKELNKSTYIVFGSCFLKKTLNIRLTDFLNPRLFEDFVSKYKHNRNDFILESHCISSKITGF
jgi:hypothetical protein